MKTVIINNLEWQAEDDEIERTWQEAINYAAFLGNRWRLPTIKELFSIIDFNKFDPACKIKTCRSSYYWSSSPYASHSSNAWAVNLGYGFVYDYDKGNHNYVRCVRDIARGTKMKIVCPQCDFSIAVDV